MPRRGASRFNDHPRRHQLKYFAIFSSEESKSSPRTTLLSSLTSSYFPRLSLLIEGDRDLAMDIRAYVPASSLRGGQAKPDRSRFTSPAGGSANDQKIPISDRTENDSITRTARTIGRYSRNCEKVRRN